MNNRKTENAARKARLAQMRRRRALFDLLRKRRAPAIGANRLPTSTRIGRRGPAADWIDPETGDVIWRSTYF